MKAGYKICVSGIDVFFFEDHFVLNHPYFSPYDIPLDMDRIDPKDLDNTKADVIQHYLNDLDDGKAGLENEVHWLQKAVNALEFFVRAVDEGRVKQKKESSYYSPPRTELFFLITPYFFSMRDRLIIKARKPIPELVELAKSENRIFESYDQYPVMIFESHAKKSEALEKYELKWIQESKMREIAKIAEIGLKNELFRNHVLEPLTREDIKKNFFVSFYPLEAYNSGKKYSRLAEKTFAKLLEEERRYKMYTSKGMIIFYKEFFELYRLGKCKRSIFVPYDPEEYLPKSADEKTIEQCREVLHEAKRLLSEKQKKLDVLRKISIPLESIKIYLGLLSSG